jgi:galactokinase
MSPNASAVNKVFRERFSEAPKMYFSPGRINLIGEHIDYNDGFVMPAAIDKGISYGLSLNNSTTINFYSIDFDEVLTINLSDIAKMDGWKNYLLGVVNEFLLAGLPVRGFNCVFAGNIPIGAGLSSSAAIEGGLAFALNELCAFGYDRRALALLCQRAEHGFPGVMCGIMDQYANMNGRQNHVILLDCRSVTHEYLPLNPTGYKIVLINSLVHHSLASSQYNLRRQDCEAGLAILKKQLGIHSFRDIVEVHGIASFKDILGDTVYKRCSYVIEEIGRTRLAARLLQEGQIEAFGKLMFETHEGLSKLYEVSCKELDFLVDLAGSDSNVVGARLMGGGFGGCTINIIRENAAAQFLSGALAAYKKEFGINAEVYEVNVVDGTHAL